MLSLTPLISFFFLAIYSSTIAGAQISDYSQRTPSIRPLVIWHGLGDYYNSPGMLEFADMIREVHEGIFVWNVRVVEDWEESADSGKEDRNAGFYGNVNTQMELVAKQLAEIPELKNGFDAIGFSQGGQFLRAYVERYNSPPVHNLITFGSQHMGISDIPSGFCNKWDFICQSAVRAVKNAAYSNWAQHNLVQAQYFRNPKRLDEYLEMSGFLSDVNNEISADEEGTRNKTYKENLISLNKFVLIMFTEDKTVVPKESSWFGSWEEEDGLYNGITEQQVLSTETSIPMQAQPLYIQDWIGLRTLDERGDVVLKTCEGEHMQIGGCWEELVRAYSGGLVY